MIATWLKLLRNDVVACGINESLVKYRILDNSLSSGDKEHKANLGNTDSR